MYFIYSFIIRIYSSAIRLASFFNPKAKRWINGRKNWKEKFSSLPFHENKWAWFHCCSFGEFQDGKSVIEAFHQRYPNHKIILTFYSPTGFELVQNYENSDLVFYLPPDTKTNAAFFLNCLKPSIVFFIRNDIWPNYLLLLKEKHIPSYLVSFTLSEKSRFLKFPQKLLYKNSFQQFNGIFVQDVISKELLQKNNFNKNIAVTGNSRIDRVQAVCDGNFLLPDFEKFTAGKLTVVAGSTLEKDKAIFLETYAALQNENIQWIIVPHEIEEHEISEMKQQFGEELIFFTGIEHVKPTHKILYVDHVGLLAKIYRYTDIAFIGGGFTKAGIHNILEPAAFGCMICIGPNHKGLPEAADLLKQGAAIINNADDLTKIIRAYHNNHNSFSVIKAATSSYVKTRTGATKKVIGLIEATGFSR